MTEEADLAAIKENVKSPEPSMQNKIYQLTTKLIDQQALLLIKIYNSYNNGNVLSHGQPRPNFKIFDYYKGPEPHLKIQDKTGDTATEWLKITNSQKESFDADLFSTISHIKNSMFKLVRLRDLVSGVQLQDSTNILQDNAQDAEPPLDLVTKSETMNKASSEQSARPKANIFDLINRDYHQAHCRALGEPCGFMLPSCCKNDEKYKTNVRLCCDRDTTSNDSFKKMYGLCLPLVYGDTCPTF